MLIIQIGLLLRTICPLYLIPTTNSYTYIGDLHYSMIEDRDTSSLAILDKKYVPLQ